jgi:hypothetical protein
MKQANPNPMYMPFPKFIEGFAGKRGDNQTSGGSILSVVPHTPQTLSFSENGEPHMGHLRIKVFPSHYLCD